MGFHYQVDTIEEAANFSTSLIIKVGGFSEVMDSLVKSISQGLSERELEYSLPEDNHPDWLAFKDEGSSVSFKVSQVDNRCLKAMVICIMFSSLQVSSAVYYPLSFLIKNYTKASIDFYKRDSSETSSNEEEWHKISSNLDPGNEVEVKVDFAHKYIVLEKTIVYLVYGDDDTGRRIVE
ncbi:hypothetical protein QN277_023061 [Acacia crassicarpa]|uniref:Uncharacterized protein n=1 Tax=Acacia crassicarpa TaxID=499986 RepID=A0AAE1JGJ1_9FABA|nr:hypothetical protein QN277_023061 [Acacia crassicarpa]